MYRVPYPPELLSFLREQAECDGTGSLVDLGTGTGEIAVPMSRHFEFVHAVDSSKEMIQEGKARAKKANANNITWHLSEAEKFKAEEDSVSLVTIGAAFHWMNRKLIAQHCQKWLLPCGALSVLGGSSTWTGTSAWQETAREVMKKWLGERRRAGSGNYSKPKERYEDILTQEGFIVSAASFDVDWRWTVDQYIGYLYSTSFASRSVLGEKADAFELDMRTALSNLAQNDVLKEVVKFQCILAKLR